MLYGKLPPYFKSEEDLLNKIKTKHLKTSFQNISMSIFWFLHPSMIAKQTMCLFHIVLFSSSLKLSIHSTFP